MDYKHPCPKDKTALFAKALNWWAPITAAQYSTNFNYGNPDNEEAISLLNGSYQNSFSNVTLSPGDYDGDGKTDLVVAERTGNVNGDGTGIESTTSSAYNVITNVGVRPGGYIEPSQYELTHTYAPTTYMKADEVTSPFSYYSTDYRGTGHDGILRPSKIFHRFQDSRGDWHDDGMNYTDAIYIEDFTKSGGSMSVNSNNILPFPTVPGLLIIIHFKRIKLLYTGRFQRRY